MVLQALSSLFLMTLMLEAIKWHKNSINPFLLHAFYLWEGLAIYVYSLYGIPKGVKRDVARHEVHFLSLWI
jgi:hypothetical protein